MKDEPIPVSPTRPVRKSKGGIKVAGAVAAGVLALGTGAGALAANHVGAQADSHAGSGATVDKEQNLAASDLFGVSKPSAETTPEATPDMTTQPEQPTIVTMPAPKTTTTSHETEHETEDHSGSGSSSGGDD